VHVIPATPVSAHGPSLTTTHASVIDLVLSIEKSFSAFDVNMIAGFKRCYRTLTLNKLNRLLHRLLRWPLGNIERRAVKLDIIIGRCTYRSGLFHLSNPAPRLLGRWRSRGLLRRWRGLGSLCRLGPRHRGRSEQDHGARNDDREDQSQETCI